MSKNFTPDLQFDPSKFTDVMVKAVIQTLAETVTIRQQICELKALIVSEADSPHDAAFQQAFRKIVEETESLSQDNYNEFLLRFHKQYGKP